MGKISKALLDKEQAIYNKEYDKLYDACIENGGKETFCETRTLDQLEVMGWYEGEDGKAHNTYMEGDDIDRKDLRGKVNLGLDKEYMKKGWKEYKKRKIFNRTNKAG